MTFKNEHVSVSRLKRYEQCPRAFALTYVDKAPNATRDTFTTRFELDLHEGAAFGTVMHTTLETIYRWIVREEHVGAVPEEVISECYRNAFQASDLTGSDTFAEGRQILRAYFERHYLVDHMTVLDIEREFRIERDGVTLLGYIDRVDKIADDAIRIVDYKTNRLLFTREEVDSDLQMSVYGVAARVLYPWAKRVEYAFDMLRHDVRMTTERDEADLQEASDYVVALTRRIEQVANDPNATFPAVMNTLCHWCGQRERCDAYERAMRTDGSELKLPIPLSIDEISAERERVAAIKKLYDNRQRVLDNELKHALKQSKQDDLLVNGFRYRMIPSNSKSYPADRTVGVLKTVVPMTEAQIRDAILVVDSTKLDALVKSIEVERKAKAMLKTNLEAICTLKPKAARLDSRAQKVKLG